ncbi:MAG: acetyl-CoA carboxylase biotin carboxyl carrier protein [Ruminococcus sp.]|nr:acetyl-CoA carboxylase biotin carboxyl carrier protein [Ruminococcus sp.]
MSKLDFDFTFENIERLADIVNDKELSEISLEGGDGVKLTIKGKKSVPAPMPPMPPMPPMAPMAAPMAAPAAMPVQAAADTAAPAADSGKEVKAPIVGTFYAAPSPDSKPFVSVGDAIHKGDTIYIIESMKVMSEVQSEVDGIVKEICVSNGDPVEYDQTVMILE